MKMGITPGPWHAIGPFTSPEPFKERFAPENPPVVTLSENAGGKGWMRQDGWLDGEVIALPTLDLSANYLARELQARSATEVRAYLGSDDGIKIWLNGALLFEHDVHRGCARNQEVVPLPLRPGRNLLLMKITNGGGPTAFYFSLTDLDPSAIWDLVSRDFPQAREEMEWEREDGIWEVAWLPGQYAPLAGRYAARRDALAPEIGAAPLGGVVGAPSEAELWKIRQDYIDARRRKKELRAREAAELTLTPKSPPAPRINGPKIYGARPGNPVLYRIPATGTRPMEYSAEGLPAGLHLDRKSGRISGTVRERGRYPLTLKAKNAHGEAERQFTLVIGDTIALTPPLGWNSWNCFAADVDDAKVRAAAEAMVRSGLADHGWTYINIDDCWQVKGDSRDPVLGGRTREQDGTIRTNRKFPDMNALSDHVHDLGLKLGIYSSPGPLTCAGYTASLGHELQDARTYASWGIDYLKYDWCSYDRVATDRSLPELQRPYRLMRSALDSVNRDIVYSLCQYGMGDVWEWGGEVGGNCWRTTGDITDTWESMSEIGFGQAGHEAHAGPGRWNDPDMLVVGYVGWGPSLHPTRLSPHEQMTHLTLWSLLASPLLIGCDMTRLDEFTLSLLTNDEVLAVNQDGLGHQASRVAKDGPLEVWAKELEDGSKAVGLFNRGEKRARVRVLWSDLGASDTLLVRDLWRQKDLGLYDGSYEAEVARHGAVLLGVRAKTLTNGSGF
jgi:alpha-galactosidase